ncbi:C10 family peptidase [Porphyromonas asaccharolytica]|uniref:C10 family peptidase n=1 Tax=Porphyromonas asaccharolytica TaxID=28123 RepID=UPI00248D82B8|nr:C10 family peptidase [Porphyromonas asaccharolytica]
MSRKKSLVAISLLVASFIGLLLLSCTRQERELRLDINKESKGATNLLSEAEAIDQARVIYGVLFSKELRATDIPSILSVQKTSSLRSLPATKDNEGVYVINFKDDKGYIVISENRYNEPIITASSNGYLDISAVTKNMNLIPVLSNTDAILEFNQERKVITDLSTIDGRPISPKPILDRYRYEFGPWETVVQAGPLVQVEWNQKDPHNRKLTPINGQLPPVGCVATAMSQIMSYHRHPQYNWDKIIANMYDPYSADILSTLHRDLGKPENLDMGYSLSGSGAYSSNVPRTFRAYGYQSSDLCDYKWATIKSEIFAQRPVFIRANCFKHVTKTPRFLFWGGETKTSYSGGHAWVLDGIKSLRRKVTQINIFTNEVVDVSFQKKELVHCNFGWGGIDNGYYLSKAFNTVKGPEMRSSESPDNGTYGEDYNFQYNHQIIKDIRRK